MPRALTMLAALVLSVGCYGGEGTLGGACERQDDCGGEQTCERGVCGLCGDGLAQAGELCLDDATPADVEGASSQTPRLVDLNADGREDLLWVVEGGIAISTFSANGLTPATVLPFDATAIWTGDALGDGAIEVLVRDAAGGASLWSPRIEGQWSPREGDLEALRGLVDAALDPQLGIVALVSGELVHVSQMGEEATTIGLPESPVRIVGSADVDGDGGREVVLIVDAPRIVWVDTAASEEERVASLALPQNVRDVQVVAINTDAADDLVVLDDEGRVSVWLADRQGGFVESVSTNLPPSTSSLAIVDVTLDGQLDVLGYGPQTDGVRLSIRRGAELDRAAVVVDGPWTWIASTTVGLDPFVDLLVFDGASFSFAERQP